MNIVSNVITREEKRRVLSRSIADFVIKLYGSCEYIFENVPIGDIVPIRESLKRSRENIAFVLFPRYMLETELKIFFDREKVLSFSIFKFDLQLIYKLKIALFN